MLITGISIALESIFITVSTHKMLLSHTRTPKSASLPVTNPILRRRIRWIPVTIVNTSPYRDESCLNWLKRWTSIKGMIANSTCSTQLNRSHIKDIKSRKCRWFFYKLVFRSLKTLEKANWAIYYHLCAAEIKSTFKIEAAYLISWITPDEQCCNTEWWWKL